MTSSKNCLCFSRHCPIGFNFSVSGLSKCYAILSDRANWTTAQKRCKGLHRNAQLAVIMNKREQSAIYMIILEHGMTPSFIYLLMPSSTLER